VDKTLTHRTLVANARTEIRHLKPPPGMRSGSWHDIQELLRVLAGYLPEVWPSQRTLAAKLGCSQPTVHRRVSAAVDLGLLHLTTRPNQGWLDGTVYHLTCLSTGLKADCSRYASRFTSASEVVLSLSEKESSPLPSGGAHGSAGPGLAAEHTLEAGVPRHVPDDDPDPIGADPHAPLPQHRVKPPDPGKELALYFDNRWHDRARRSSQWRGTRPSDRGKAIGYLRGVMLTQVDPDIARAHIDAFISAVFSGEVELKEEQLPFERFTGWWGRQAVADPVETARLNEIKARLLADRDEHLRRLDGSG